MKIFIYFLIFLLNVFPGYVFQNAYAETSEKQYAKALDECVLYKTKDMLNSTSDVLFEIPETYFVLILETVNDNCYKVQYDKYVGYIESSKVIIASFTPIVKTLSNITFDIKETSGTQIWSGPSTNSDIYTTVAAGTKNITYIASVQGGVPSDGESNIWYYVFYTPSNNSTNVYEGYIYSENTTNLSEIVANTESNPEVIVNEYPDENTIYVSSTIKTIIVAIISIPIILFFVIILYKLIKKINKNTKYNKNNHLRNDLNYDESVKNKNLNLIEKFKNMIRLKSNRNSENVLDLNDDELL